jgi:MoaA/NifB/PqqE/SkfB family radical SAM enzyme
MKKEAQRWTHEMCLRLFESPLSRNLRMQLLRLAWVRRVVVSRKWIYWGRMPHTVMLAITDRCQCNCAHCGVSTNRSRSELTTSEIFVLIDRMAHMHAKTLVLFGGEPLLHPDLELIVRYAKSRNLIVEMDSNGLNFTPQLTADLKQAGLDLVRLSLDSHDSHEHDVSRGYLGIYNHVLAAIGWCREEGLACHISTFIDKAKINGHGLDAIISLAESLGTPLRLLKPVLSGHLLHADHLRLDAAEMKRLQDVLRPGKRYLEVELVDAPKKPFVCSAMLKKYVYIASTGELQPCCYLPYSFGNVRDMPLESLVAIMHRHEMFSGDIWQCPMNNPEFRARYLQEPAEPAAQRRAPAEVACHA